eukprot:304533-Prorocentrum_lima.AAC.1
MTSSLVGSEMCIRDRMSDQSEPFAMWDSGASQFLLPPNQLPNGGNRHTQGNSQDCCAKCSSP